MFKHVARKLCMLARITTQEQLKALFPKTIQDIETVTAQALDHARQALDELCSIPDAKRTFDNTARALDSAVAAFNSAVALMYSIEMVHPDEMMRNAAHINIVQLQQFSIDNFVQNSRLYQAFTYYAHILSNQEHLTTEQRYYIQEQLEFYKRNGVHLSEQARQRLGNIQKELSEDMLAFDRAIAENNNSLAVTREQLAGVSEQFILGLVQDLEGNYILGTDYPTYFYILENCTQESTRKALWLLFVNRAYPANETELAKIIALRDEWAQLVGYESFAQLDIANQMAQTPQQVEQFLQILLDRCTPVVEREKELLKNNLPEGVLLVDNKFKPWDYAFVKAQYKQKYLAVNEAEIAQYFPLEHTLAMLLEIYQEFLGLTFKKTHIDTLWHEHIDCVSVYKDNMFLGTLLLDLFPRPGKYSHACYINILPALTSTTGDNSPALGLVIANFPPAQAQVPSLLQRRQVVTFFHEFGHALHGLLGSTELGAFSGTRVKRDFVEMPSQMLEEWLWDPVILRRISKHYITSERLPDTVINNILALQHFDSGAWVQRQVYYSLLSLDYFKQGTYKNLEQVQQQLAQRVLTYLQFYPEDHDYASFGHLTGYGAKYYGYLWSKVFALDMFDYIKNHGGPLDRTVGQHYINTVLKPGGSKPPQQLLRDFLGREPRADAFFNQLGI